MKDFASNNNIKPESRRTLVGGMAGKKIMLATPLLKWYIEHGLEITRVYQGIEYTPKECFSDFVSNVSNSRRDGDADSSKSILADTSKLIGKSLKIFLKIVHVFSKIKLCFITIL